MKRICPYCKEEFEAQRKDKNYCSASCRQQSYLIRKGTSLLGNETSLIQTVKTSNDVLLETNNDVSNDVLTNNQNVIEQSAIQNHGIKEKEYKWINSSFLDKLINKLRDRNMEYHLSDLNFNHPIVVSSIQWINIRFRYLIESILTLSERRKIAIVDLIDITNAFTLMLQSDQYKNLPETYPYTHDIKRLRNKLKGVCLEMKGLEEMCFRIRKEMKAELIVLRCELRTVAEKKPFNHLDFNQPKTKEPCKTNHHQNEKESLKGWRARYEEEKKKEEKQKLNK